MREFRFYRQRRALAFPIENRTVFREVFEKWLSASVSDSL